jgi:hypothetical protein
MRKKTDLAILFTYSALRTVAEKQSVLLADRKILHQAHLLEQSVRRGAIKVQYLAAAKTFQMQMISAVVVGYHSVQKTAASLARKALYALLLAKTGHKSVNRAPPERMLARRAFDALDYLVYGI